MSVLQINRTNTITITIKQNNNISRILDAESGTMDATAGCYKKYNHSSHCNNNSLKQCVYRPAPRTMRCAWVVDERLLFLHCCSARARSLLFSF